MVRYYAVHKFFNTGESDVSGNTLQEGLEFPSAQEINPAHVLKFLLGFKISGLNTSHPMSVVYRQK